MAAHPVSLFELLRSQPIVHLRAEMPGDVSAREALLDAAMGPGRVRKSSEALRRGRLPADGLALVAETEDGTLIGSVRLWNVAAGERGGAAVSALLLGPLAVLPGFAGFGIGSSLMRRAIAEAAFRGHDAIVLVGDAPYYERFGFSADVAAGLTMPGPFERHRLLGLEIEPGALHGAEGMISATGREIASEAIAAAA
ncbi:acetyltransferase [Aureimonas ureilytica]|uniref:Acetyltransferase n=2 Tax=Aureimonas ureilytica TaxID=401562 RepID=A0A175RQZ4_9HYPH|nr:N-acetyltransferase [Aureimonas ureilytica]KTR05758.1 acetyltransferase [Aureimonas ureilytica]